MSGSECSLVSESNKDSQALAFVRDTASFPYLGEVIQRLDDVSLDGDLEKDELLSEFVLRVAAELQHLPAKTDSRSRTRQRNVRGRSDTEQSVTSSPLQLLWVSDIYATSLESTVMVLHVLHDLMQQGDEIWCNSQQQSVKSCLK